ncbi:MULTISPECIES: COG3650 family protein [unclassified Caulobacter]|uniref:COG3650 family protein n=1 Tax=unclassified Caulobacter TaxID=2648921 RepID=UPI000D37CB3D|nr:MULTISPECIES: hypothetical protein [unclassified Caulobacter]PTS88999.1 hypothetical protein DBR21_07890 [Caulobacter sp. HMWF009]PTT13070.1 hypothetical protein DBR10_00395 [Caulobacter sp. HMWF025]
MVRTAALTVLLALLAACGPGPMGASEEAPPPADAPDALAETYAGDFDVVGTEPFWSVKIRASGLVLTRPDQPERRQSNPGVRLDGVQGIWDSSAGEARLVVRLTPGACGDGMSDRVYRYFAEVWIDGETRRGCADRPDALQSQPRP